MAMNNPYLLDPDVPTMISFSGGRTSGYLLHKILQVNDGIPDNCRVVFTNTGKEYNETLDFIHKVETAWDVKIYWIEWIANKARYVEVDYETASRNGEPFQANIRWNNFVPKTINRICTIDLKVRTSHRFMANQFGKKTPFRNILGIRYDEPRRWKIEDTDVNKWCENDIPLKYAGIRESDVLNFWANNEFDVDLLPGESNCDLCFLKATNKIVSILQNDPDRADWWIKQEDFIEERTTIKDTTKLFRKDRPTYRRLKEIALSQQAFDFFDDPSLPCNCHD